MAPRTIGKGKSVLVSGYRIKVIAIPNTREVCLGFEVATGPEKSDVVEIAAGATGKDLQFVRLKA